MIRPKALLGAVCFLIAPIVQAAEVQAAEMPPSPVPSFRDCPDCPEMSIIPAGQYKMGSPHGDTDEVPVHAVVIAAPFAIGRHPVTFAEWDACVADKGCTYKPDDAGQGRGQQPVVNVSWNDIQQYMAWLSKKTGHVYRLPPESKFEYAARAGSATDFPWGDKLDGHHMTCDDCTDRNYAHPLRVGTGFPANAWGLTDMHYNVLEWMADCYHTSFTAAPADGSPWTGKCAGGLRKGHVSRGSSWYRPPGIGRVSNRGVTPDDVRVANLGFRPVRDVTVRDVESATKP